MSKRTFNILVILFLIVFVGQLSAKGGSRGGGRSRGGSHGFSWGGGGSRSHSSSSYSHASPSHSSASKGNWFTNLFRSKSSTTSSNAAKSNHVTQPITKTSKSTTDWKTPEHSSGPSTTYGWSTSSSGRRWDTPKAQPRQFAEFSPQNNLHTTSYHFIPISMPHHHTYHSHAPYHHSHASPFSTSYNGNTSIESTSTLPPPIVDPMVYEWKSKSVNEDNQRHKLESPLVLAVNNMVVFGHMNSMEHLVMVIDENNEYSHDEPMIFVDNIENDEIIFDYSPTSTNAPSTTATASTVDSSDTSEVMKSQWFSDIDGAI